MFQNQVGLNRNGLVAFVKKLLRTSTAGVYQMRPLCRHSFIIIIIIVVVVIVVVVVVDVVVVVGHL